MHCDRRAQRYMEKLLLKDMWREWRRVMGLPYQDQFTDAKPAAPVASPKKYKQPVGEVVKKPRKQKAA